MSVSDSAWRLAFNRFGLGARPGAAMLQGDPRAALLAEIAQPGGARLDDPELSGTPEILQAVYADEWRRKMERDRAETARIATPGAPTPNVAAPISPSPTPTPEQIAATAGAMAGAPPPPEPPPQQKFFRADAQARLEQACTAPIGFLERLGVEREAIRPHVLGRFADMLRAVEQHPAMLNFLDNAQSVGPNSKAGKNRKLGLNENLAREILELHTMGVGSGYSQADVTALARIITGWTISGRDGKLGEPGSFVFNANAHEPGSATLLGRFYAEEGVAQGEAALADLAREGATADHIARKFVRHFVADSPDPELAARLAAVYRDTDGDLGALARALVADEAVWSAPATKIRNPWELTIAAYRAFSRSPSDPGPALAALNLLGMPLWQPGSPNGFSDVSSDWASPEGIKMRVELVAQFARQIKDAPPPPALVEDILGPGASAETREAVTHAESREQAYALLILSPEFQRR